MILKLKILKWVTFVVMGILVLSACYYDNELELYPGDCDVSLATYQDIVLPIIENKCYGCHAASAAQGGIVLEGYEALVELVDDGSFACSINWNSGCSPMPKNSSQLPNCELAVINKWLAEGALNN